MCFLSCSFTMSLMSLFFSSVRGLIGFMCETEMGLFPFLPSTLASLSVLFSLIILTGRISLAFFLSSSQQRVPSSFLPFSSVSFFAGRLCFWHTPTNDFPYRMKMSAYWHCVFCFWGAEFAHKFAKGLNEKRTTTKPRLRASVWINSGSPAREGLLQVAWGRQGEPIHGIS